MALHHGDLAHIIGAIHFNEAIRLDPKDPHSQYGLGIALVAKKDLDGAIAAYLVLLEHLVAGRAGPTMPVADSRTL